MKKLLAVIMILAVAAVTGVMLFPSQALRLEFARLRLLAGAEVQEKTVAGERWHYLEAGQGPLIVLVHGYTGSKENWLPVMRQLARDHRVIAVDLPGWGESIPVSGADYGPTAQAERLSAFLQSEREPAALLVGHSMGGMISGLMATAHPQQVERIVFMSSAGVRFKENEFARRVLKGDNPFAVYEVESFRRFLGEFVFADAPYVPEPMLSAIVEQRKIRRDFEQRVFTQIRIGPEAFLLQQRLSLIQSPAGLLWCDGDRIIDPSAAPVFAAGLKSSETRILKDCGHMPMMEQPGAVAEFLLARF
ncbi:MAG: alpha/beta fold hydrolase [Xanthomonadaceae bacterium]|jgi:abhydrolase domain-containing protein 6|nr:alpha/beta fold hydrolase [Xanthomonadaceae bacterium]